MKEAQEAGVAKRFSLNEDDEGFEKEKINKVRKDVNKEELMRRIMK